MSERLLRERMLDLPVPDAEGAERRGLAVVEAAFAERRARRAAVRGSAPPRLPRLAISLAAIALLAGLLLSPAGAGVRDWFGDAFTAGVEDAEPALTEVPGGGRLLVQSRSGPWVVQPDGSRRLLGSYGEAAWSPHGLFVAAAGWRSLSAVEPGGTVRWSLSAAAPVTMPRWSPSGERIAYRAGRSLRVVAGDGDRDKLIDRGVAPLPAAWAPLGPHLLAYARAGDELRVVNTDSGETVASAAAMRGVEVLEWARDGGALLEAGRSSVAVREVAVDKLGGGLRIGPPRQLPLPPEAAVVSASLPPDGPASPGGGTVAVLLALPARGERPPHSEVLLLDPGGGPSRLLLTAPGRLSDLEWSPDGTRLLLGWPDADQWLFIPAGGTGKVQAVGGISSGFAPGEDPSDAAFPRVEGWCCVP